MRCAERIVILHGMVTMSFQESGAAAAGLRVASPPHTAAYHTVRGTAVEAVRRIAPDASTALPGAGGEAVRWRAEREEARQIQQALLPPPVADFGSISMRSASMPADAVGGDWYDAIALPRGRWGIALGDAAGKGMAAALLASEVRGMLRAIAPESRTPGAALERLNQSLSGNFPQGRFVTLLYGVLNPRARTFAWSSAGHPWPLLADASRTRVLGGAPSFPLGLFPCAFAENKIALERSFRIVLYSDGITEAANPSREEYGLARLLHLVEWHRRRPADVGGNLLETIQEDVHRFTAPGAPQDDATVCVLEA